MTIGRTGLAVILLGAWSMTSFASAQWDSSTQEGTSTTATTAPTAPAAPPDQMVSDTPYPAVQQPEEKKKAFKPASFTWSLGIGVPIVLDVPLEVVRPGASIFFFGGADFGFFVVGGDFGLQWNPINLNNAVVNGVALSGRAPLTRIYLSIPEVRFQVPNLKVALPYISGAFDMNFWNFRESQVGCGYWYCSAYAVYRFTPGFTGKVGTAFNIKESGVHIDVAFQFSFTGKGNFFNESGWWLAPVIGVLVRRDKG